jgi:Rps23 Pro-64 3,4-dihydroxylase Tpa1-like proline 4-hydroxylase
MLQRTGTLDLMAAAQRFESPFRYVTFGPDTLLSGADVDRLVETFPGDQIMAPAHRSHGSDKTYFTRTVTLHELGQWSPKLASLDESWRDLLSWLADSSYLTDLARLLQLAPEPVQLEIRATEYTGGGWMSRHTDRPEKLFSQNLYLCPGWQSEWGGGLALYGDALAEEPATTFVPGAGTSVAFARSDQSWHEVLPVSASARRPRRAVLVHGYRQASDDHEERYRQC